MADPTVADVKARARELLDDTIASPNERYNAAAQTAGFEQAWETVHQMLLYYQIPRVKVITSGITIAVGVVTYDPGVNFGELIKLEERLSGSTDRWVELTEVDWLTQREAQERLGEFSWYGDAFAFVGATSIRELRMSYYATGTAPTSGQIAIPGSKNVLAKLTAAAMAPRKGQYELAKAYKEEVLGPDFARTNKPGGEMHLLLWPMARALQRVPKAPRPFRAGITVNRRIQPVFIGPAEHETSMVDLTITGAVNGINTTFTLSDTPYPTSSLIFLRNGVVQYEGLAFTLAGNIVTFIAPYIPQTGDELRAKAQVQ